METKFTKGEWKIVGGEYGLYDHIKDDKGRFIAEVKSYEIGKKYPNRRERKANSKLIASAPEMYEALAETEKDLCVLETTMRQIELTDKRAEGMVELVIKWRERNKQVLKKATE